MFARRTRGLFDLSMAVLCLWAAGYHTPMGALVRRTGARLLGVRTSARPVLAYFSGEPAAHPGEGAWVTPDLPVLPATLVATPGLALGLGLHASLRQLPRGRLGAVSALAQAEGISFESLLDDARGPGASAELLEKLAQRLGSEDAAVLAAFAGLEPSRYARDRARALGVERPTLEQLVRQLPPGFEDAAAASADALAFATAYGLDWPVPVGTPISSGFGMRRHPLLGVRKLHTGVDLPQKVGSPVRATADGVVRRASEDGVNGRVLVIDHGRGVTTAYCHNSLLLARVGDAVRRGQVIARSGNTGRSTGPHVHYQLELRDRPVDPLAFRPRRERPPSITAVGLD